MRLLKKMLLAALGVALVLGMLPVSAGAEETVGVTEEWQTKIDKGTVTIRISSEVTLDGDFTLPNGVNLYIRPKGTLVIPDGVTLRLAGYFSTLAEGKILVEAGGELICESGLYVQEKGSLSVENGGSLFIRDCEVNCGPESAIDISGSYYTEESAGKEREYFVLGHYQNGKKSSISGISQRKQGILFDIRSQQDLHYAMDAMSSTDYAAYFLEIRGNVTLPSDWTLPKNSRTSIMTGEGSLTIPENTRLVNNGVICIYANSLAENCGMFENNGELWIYGWLFNRAQTNLNAGSYSAVEGTVTNDASVYAHEDSTMDVKGTWEGNPATSVDSEHVHSFFEVVTAPTCTEQGYTTSKCWCGESTVSDYTDPLGHDYDEGTFILKPDCVTEGLVRYTCRNDDSHSYSVLVPATGHSFMDNVCTVCGYALPGGDAHSFHLGDVNHDGKVNAKDATLILQKSVGVLKAENAFCDKCAEVSGDGKLNAKDSTLILQYSVGLRTAFPAEK